MLPLSGEMGSITTLIEQLKYCCLIRATIGELQIEDSWKNMCEGYEEMRLFTGFRLSSEALKSAYLSGFIDFSSVAWAYVLPTPTEDIVRKFHDDVNLFIAEGDLMLTLDFDEELTDDLINFLIDLSPISPSTVLFM